jgi:uncharacterized membrane protein (UPF0127 family)
MSLCAVQRWGLPRFSRLSTVVPVIALLLFALSGALLGCNQDFGSPQVKAVFESPNGGARSQEFTLEVFHTGASRAKGLMFRKSMESNHGALFTFPGEEVRSFWMKNTFISLDMVYVNSEMNVVGVLENVPPLTEEPRSVGIPTKYVLEFIAGTAKQSGIGAGSKLIVTGQVPEALS